MTNPQGPPIPAGWFRDPGGTDQLRWWDGTAWTSHLAPVPTPQPTPTIAPAQSPAAVDPDDRPYVPFQNAWSSNAGGHDAGGLEFARPAQWNTAAVWWLATSTYWIYLGGVVLGFFAEVLLRFPVALIATGTPGYWATLVGTETVSLVILLLIAGADRARLLRMGYLHPASIWWILLFPFAPLAYLIARTVRVRSESGRGAAPLVFFIVNGVGLFLIGAAVAIPLVIAQHGTLGDTVTQTSNATSLATGITAGMEKNGGSYSVTCTPFAKPTTSPVEVTCIAVDLTSQKSHTLQIEVDPSTDGGQPSVKLLSVNPPINQ